MQDTFIIAYRKLERYNPEYAFATWVFTIANRLAISNYRKQKPQVEEFDFATDETPLCVDGKRKPQAAIWGRPSACSRIIILSPCDCFMQRE